MKLTLDGDDVKQVDETGLQLAVHEHVFALGLRHVHQNAFSHERECFVNSVVLLEVVGVYVAPPVVINELAQCQDVLSKVRHRQHALNCSPKN